MRLIALLVAIASTVTTARDERAMGMLRDWLVAVQQHAVGEPDAALARISAWSYDDLEKMRTYVETLAGAPTKGNPDRARRRRVITAQDQAEIAELRKLVARDFSDFLKRAVLLHTDAVLLSTAPPVMVRPPPAGSQQKQRVNVRSFDGRLDSFELANPHWDFAMDLLESLPALPRRDPIVALWFRAIGAYFARERNHADAMPHFTRGRQMAPDAAEIMFGEACLEETLGSPREQEYVRNTVLPNGNIFQGVESPTTHFRRAESLQRRALAAEPTLVEARLRLGRVLAQLERHEEALAELLQVVATSPDETLGYYAYLFIGDASQALGRLDAARAAYEAAIQLYPRAQAARIGLGAAARAAGDRAAALTAILPTLEEPAALRDSDDEPWWNYYDGDAANLSVLLDRLRAPFEGRAQ